MNEQTNATRRTRTELLQDPRRVLPSALRSGDTVECWIPSDYTQNPRGITYPATPSETFTLAHIATCDTKRDRYGRWVDADDQLVHSTHVLAVDDEEEGFAATPDTHGATEILLRIASTAASHPPFAIGDQVVHKAYTDSDGRYHPQTPVLTVAQVRLIECRSIPSYWRVLADGPGLSSYEGAANRFAPTTSE